MPPGRRGNCSDGGNSARVTARPASRAPRADLLCKSLRVTHCRISDHRHCPRLRWGQTGCPRFSGGFVMALPQCTCSPACVTPAACPCVYRGRSVPLPFMCGVCGFTSQGYWPVGWKAVVVKCPHCSRESKPSSGRVVSFAGLPANYRSAIVAAAASSPSAAAASRVFVPGSVAREANSVSSFSLADWAEEEERRERMNAEHNVQYHNRFTNEG